jgi:DNA adenine methylase
MDNYPDWYVGFVGFVCSFRGIFFCSYVRNDVLKKSGRVEHYQKEQINNILKQSTKISDVIFKCSSYDALDIPANSIIYCDPPYNGTTKYKDSFDSDAFWQWCRDKAKEGHTVYVSEYNAPEDFKCIWEKQINSNLGGTSKTATEKLFTI